MNERHVSIRRRLLVFLISSLLLMLSGGATVAYLVAVKSANDAYDRSLLDPAIDIADNVIVDAAGAQVNLPQKALEALVFDHIDKVVYQVRSASGSIVDGVEDLAPAPELGPGQHVFFDTTYEGEPIRIAALHAGNGFDRAGRGNTAQAHRWSARFSSPSWFRRSSLLRRWSRSRWHGSGWRAGFCRWNTCAPN